MRSAIFFLSVLLFICGTSYAQNDSISMEGSLSVYNGATFKYKLRFASINLKGYSLLDEGGPNETKSSVTIKYQRAQQALVFAEKKLLQTKLKEKNFCFVGGMLKIDEQKKYAKGFFLGQDEHKKMCGTGSVKLRVPPQLMEALSRTDSNDVAIKSIITSQQSDTLVVKNGSINIEIWDGGLNDDDSLSLSLNGQLVIPPFRIQNEKRIISIRLNRGYNSIVLKALNEGTQPPNSARISVVDQSINSPLVSFLRKNETAQLILRW
jgi:hypothetical protein